DLRDPEVADRSLHVAHMSRHPLALDDSRRVGAGADRARSSVDPRRAVRCTSTAETVALDHALEATALRAPGDLDARSNLKRVHSDLVADGGRRSLTKRKLPQNRR